MIPYQIYASGDAAISVRLGNSIEAQTHEHVRLLAALLESRPFPGFIELVAAYTTVTIYYDPWTAYKSRLFSEKPYSDAVLPFEKIAVYLHQIISDYASSSGASGANTGPRRVEIPVCYGGSLGPDLPEVAAYHGLSVQEVIDLHASQTYTVYMIGFAPGFAYLGGLHERIATPRKPVPRSRIPVGSVGIGGMQTGIYPLETPGGWNLIGRTPLELFQPKSDPPSLLQAGDEIRFVPISWEGYERLKGAHGER